MAIDLGLLGLFAVQHSVMARAGFKKRWVRVLPQPVERSHRATGPLPFKTPFLYSVVRHPLMLGLLLAFWATPRMTLGHVLFAGASASYILIGIRLEERDLRREFGDVYAAYQASEPMLVPGRRGTSRMLYQRSTEA